MIKWSKLTCRVRVIKFFCASDATKQYVEPTKLSSQIISKFYTPLDPAARQALTASPLAPGTAATLAQLRDPTRRPTEPYTPLQANIDQFVPEQPLQLPAHKLLTALRRSRKGAAPGPSGLTADTLRLVLDDETTTALFVEVCQHLAQARVPLNIAQAIGLGRMVALTKPNGGIRGLVIGDVLRRVIARCIAQVFATQFHVACAPHQFALSTRAGTGAVVHALTATTQSSNSNTILSIDGVGAYDTISRNSMLSGLFHTPEANRCLPFVLGWLHRCCCIPLPWLFCGKGLTRGVASLVGLAL